MFGSSARAVSYYFLGHGRCDSFFLLLLLIRQFGLMTEYSDELLDPTVSSLVSSHGQDTGLGAVLDCVHLLQVLLRLQL